jgi:hypothetical protein
MVGFFWTSDQLVAEAATYLNNSQQTQETNTHALSGIRTRGQTATDLRLRPHGHP